MAHTFARSLSVATLATVATLSACGLEDGFDVDGSSTSSALEQQGPVQAVADDIEDQVVGNYASLSRTLTSASAELPLVGRKTFDIKSTAYSSVTITRDGDGFVYSEQPCRLELSGVPVVSLSLLDEAVQSTGTLTAPIRFFSDDGALRYETDEMLAIVGATLDDPNLDALPTSPTDARVTDADGDGNPGVTLSASALFISESAFLVQRDRHAISGTVTDGKLSGLLAHTGEQSVLEASSKLLESLPDTEPSTDVARANATLLRTSTALSCEQLLDQSDDLFEDL
jgi:hypothetical protein